MSDLCLITEKSKTSDSRIMPLKVITSLIESHNVKVLIMYHAGMKDILSWQNSENGQDSQYYLDKIWDPHVDLGDLALVQDF